MRSNIGDQLRRAYDLMRSRHGDQRWWPAESPFEVCVGAILVQNTGWTNVERAIANLKRENLLDPAKLAALSQEQLEELIRPSGSFRVKARRLRSFLAVLCDEYSGSLEALFRGRTSEVRKRLLAVHGIGPETADCLLLYAGAHPSFVIDAYTKRVFLRHGWWTPVKIRPGASSQKGASRSEYEELQAVCESSLSHLAGADRMNYWGDYHAQLVKVGKNHCRSSAPKCDDCPLAPLLPSAGHAKTGAPIQSKI